MFIVTPLNDLQGTLARHPRAHVCGLLSPEMPHPELSAPEARRLKLSFHDLAAPRPGFRAAGRDDVRALIAFAARWRKENAGAPLIFHCWAGVSRSPAAAFIARCAMEPERSEEELARALRALSPSATPNPRLISLADAILNRQGRMIAAIAAIGRGREAFSGETFLWP